MNFRFRGFSVLGIVALIIISACSPQSTNVPGDAEATAVAQAMFVLLTQTAGASSPTPQPVPVTLTPIPSPTPIPSATGTPIHGYPIILAFDGCWYGPGPSYTLESNISKGKRVQVLGIGNIPGWYIIYNPYFHKPCWFHAAELSFDRGVDISHFPVMTPGP